MHCFSSWSVFICALFGFDLSFISGRCSTSCVSVAHASSVISGFGDFATYHEGSSPIILLSQHGGYAEPHDIPERLPGCWDGQQCLWDKGCSPQDARRCRVTTVQDAYTKEISECIAQNALISNPADPSEIWRPHLVSSQLHRSRLDPNREKGEAAQGNAAAEEVWRQIHLDFLARAKNSTLAKCGFGLLVDIHGQGTDDFTQFGMNILQTQLSATSEADFEKFADTSTIYALYHGLKTLTGSHETSFNDIVRGPNSLGTLLNQQNPAFYGTVPSTSTPRPSRDFFSGGWAIRQHGSGLVPSIMSTRVDAVQVEFSQLHRGYDFSTGQWTSKGRDRLCQDFSRALVEFVQHWYNLAQCGATQTTNINHQPGAATLEPATSTQGIASNAMTSATTTIRLASLAAMLIVTA